MSMQTSIGFIANAAGHRQFEVGQMVQDQAQVIVDNPDLIHITVTGGDEFVCDYCNNYLEISTTDGGADPTRLFPEGQLLLIAQVDGDAICTNCLKGLLEKAVLPPFDSWGLCGCPGCEPTLIDTPGSTFRIQVERMGLAKLIS